MLRIGFVLGGGGLAWLTAISVDYTLQEIACDGAFARRHVVGLNALELSYSLVALAGAVVAAVAAWHGWRLWRGHAEAAHGGLGLAGVVVNGIFIVLLAMTSLSFLFLDACS